MRDRSLDEFFDADAGDEPPDGERAVDADAGDEREPPDEAPAPIDDVPAGGDDPAVEPAITRVRPDPAPAESTYASSPEGAPCAACGARVERRWRDEDAGGLVCGDCKEW